MRTFEDNIERRMTMVALTWPIFIETFLRMLFMNVDVFMLSAYSDKAVAAVGLINQVGFFLMVLFMMVSSGAGIVIAQYNGAQKHEESTKVISGSIYLAAVFGLGIGVIMFFLSRHVVGLFNLEEQVRDYAYDYMLIFGSFFDRYGSECGVFHHSAELWVYAGTDVYQHGGQRSKRRRQLLLHLRTARHSHFGCERGRNLHRAQSMCRGAADVSDDSGQGCAVALPSHLGDSALCI